MSDDCIDDVLVADGDPKKRGPTWLDGTPTEAAYRMVGDWAKGTATRMSSPLRTQAPTPEQEERHKAIATELKRIGEAMLNAGTVNL